MSEVRQKVVVEIDLGKEVNLKRYGQVSPTTYEYGKAKNEVPIAFITANNDNCITAAVSEVAYQHMKASVVYKRVINGGHLTFNIGKDMSWLKGEVMELIHQHNGVYQPDVEVEI